MNDAFNNQTPVIAEESQSGDGWHIYNARGDRIAAIIGSSAEDVAKTAARAINGAAAGEGATEMPLTTDPAAVVSPASAFPFRRLTTWDWFAGQALAGIAHIEVEHAAAAVEAANAADVMMDLRAKRGIV